MKYLTKIVESYRVANEAEAAKVIEEAKKDNRFELTKYEAVHKEKKAKGEVVDSWVRVTLHKEFNLEAEPTTHVEVDYKMEEGFFPEPISTKDKDEEEDEVPWN